MEAHLLALLAPLAIAFVVLTVANPRIGVYVLIAIIVLFEENDFMSGHLPMYAGNGDFGFIIADVVLAVALVSTTLYRLYHSKRVKRPYRETRFNRMMWMFLGLLTIGALRGYLKGAPLFHAVKYGSILSRHEFRDVWFFFAPYFLITELFNGKDDVKRLTELLWGLAVVKGFEGLYQFFIATKYAYEGVPVTFLDYGVNFAFCAAILLGLNLLLNQVGSADFRKIVLFLAVPMGFSLVFSLGRAVYLSTASALFFNLFIYFRRMGGIRIIGRLLLVLAVVAIVVFMTVWVSEGVQARVRQIFGNPEGNVGDRWRMTELRNSWEAIKRHPFFGLGFAQRYPLTSIDPEMLRHRQRKQLPLTLVHNSYIVIMLKTGVPGVLLFAGLMLLALKDNLGFQCRELYFESIRLAFVSSLVYLFVLMSVHIALFTISTCAFASILLGTLAVLRRSVKYAYYSQKTSGQ
jgi:hypothetical protein